MKSMSVSWGEGGRMGHEGLVLEYLSNSGLRRIALNPGLVVVEIGSPPGAPPTPCSL